MFLRLKQILLIALCLNFGNCSKILYKLFEVDDSESGTPTITGRIVYDCETTTNDFGNCTSSQFFGVANHIFAADEQTDSSNITTYSVGRLTQNSDQNLVVAESIHSQDEPVQIIYSDKLFVTFDRFTGCNDEELSDGITGFEVYEVNADGSLNNYQVTLPALIDTTKGFYPLGLRDNSLIGFGSLGGSTSTFLIAVAFEEDATATVINLAGVDDNDTETEDFSDFNNAWESYAGLNDNCLFSDGILQNPYFTQDDDVVAYLLDNETNSARQFFWLNIADGFLNNGTRVDLNADGLSIKTIGDSGFLINVGGASWEYYQLSGTGNQARLDFAAEIDGELVHIGRRLFRETETTFTEVDQSDFSDLITYQRIEAEPTGFDGFSISDTLYTYTGGVLYETTITDE